MRRKFRLPGIIKACYSTIKSARMLMLLLFLTANILSFGQEDQVTADTATVYMEDTEIIDSTSYEEDTVEAVQYFLPRVHHKDSLVLRSLPDSLMVNYRKDADFWYANKSFRDKDGTNNYKKNNNDNSKPYKPVSQRSWFQTLLWLVIIGGFACFVILYLANSNVSLFRKSGRAVNGEPEEVETDDIFAINYQREIDKAGNAGNYRLAVRLMFLRLLKNLAEKNIIQYKTDRTNLDYLMQLHSTRYYQDFFRITRNYEYSWYGQFEINQEKYARIKNDFDRFDPTIK